MSAWGDKALRKVQWSREASRGALVVLLGLALVADLGVAGWIGVAMLRGRAPASESVPLGRNLPHKQLPEQPRVIRTYRAHRVDWGLSGAEWQKRADGVVLNLSFGESYRQASDRPHGILTVPGARALCAAVLADLPPGIPTGVEVGDIRRISLRVRRGNAAAPWSGGLTFLVAEGACGDVVRQDDGADANIAAATEPGAVPVLPFNLVVRRGVWSVQRLDWVANGRKVVLKVWFGETTRIARDMPMQMTRLNAWMLCSALLSDLPEGRPDGLTRAGIAWVQFHMPDAPEDSWTYQQVDDGICRFPEGARD